MSYSGRGRGNVAVQLMQVCQGLRIQPIVQTVGYTINVEESPGALERRGTEKRLESWETERFES